MNFKYIILLLIIFSVNLLGEDKNVLSKPFELTYGRAYYVNSKLPLDFNLESFKEHCKKLIPLLKKGHLDDICYQAMDYYYFVPKKHKKQKIKSSSEVKYPLVVFLHGMGESGHDVKTLFRHPQVLTFIDPENQKKFPCYFIAPQQAKNGIWCGYTGRDFYGNSEAMWSVIRLTRLMWEKYPNIDKNRIYITGLSSGGHGTFEALAKNPGTFAGGVPISGTCLKTNDIKHKQKIAIWAFWNTTERKGMRISAIKSLRDFANLGADARYTKFHPDEKVNLKSHFAWEWAYAEPDLIPWLFAHKIPLTHKNK